MTTNHENSNSVDTDVWKKTRNVITIVLLVVTSYEIGLGHGRSERRISEYSALKAQYDRIETEYYSLRTQYQGMETQYSALKAQYDRIETQKLRTAVNEPKR